MGKLKNKKTIVFIFVLLFLFVGGTIAYYRSSDVLENIFNAGTYKTVATEVFESPTNWKPGDETPKTVTVKNEGTIPVRVRISLGIEWRNANGDIIDSYINGDEGPELAAIVNYDNLEDWTKSGGYYYYNDVLNPGEVTSSLLKSVTFNPNVENSIVCTKSNDGLTETCESNNLGYDGGTFKLFVNIETVQDSAYLSVWELDHSPYEYVGDNPCTFNGELVQGAEYVNGDYTYRYMQDYDVVNYYTHEMGWVNVDENGWGVKLTNPSATSITSPLCSSINNKPIVSTSYLYFNSPATSINFDTFDTSNVFNMSGMFAYSRLNSLDLSKINTKNVVSMNSMFMGDSFTDTNFNLMDTSNVSSMNSMFQGYRGSLDLSGFDTSNVEVMTGMFALSQLSSLDIPFDTTNVKAMANMFYHTDISYINLHTFDVSGVVVMDDMFAGTTATALYVRDEDDISIFENTSNFPSTLRTFVNGGYE